jgi:hypothetical protein
MKHTEQSDAAHKLAMELVIDNGQSPVAVIDGIIQFLENHYDGMPYDDEHTIEQEKAFTAIERLKRANRLMDKAEQFNTGVAYYAE